jgi:hypothetical protein
MTFSLLCRPVIGLAVVALAGLSAAGCSPTPSVAMAWTGPGWYLQKNNMTQLSGNSYFGGPWTYDKCEEERIKLPPETATQMLCVRENRKPDILGRS